MYLAPTPGLDRAERSAAAPATQAGIDWPRKYDVCGVQVSATTYVELVERVIEAAQQRQSAAVSFFAVHAVVTAGNDARLRDAVNRFAIIAPDGQPVRWALWLLHGIALPDRVYGPETTLRLCAAAARAGVSVYLYGSANEEILAALQENLKAAYPNLKIAGAEVPPFRALAPEEDAALVERINASGAGIVLIGLGCPKQDWFAAAHVGRIQAVMACVGAAFDFHAGAKKMAPAWMQRCGLEWLYRLAQEPRRLGRRYVVTNTQFLWRLGQALVQKLFSTRR
jgi:exopolysaccharide biosynthesis WecB/TagA/CpsF family protein